MSDQVLRATLDVPFECAFAKSGAMNGIPSYRVPPIPTLQGVVYAALGRPSIIGSTQEDRGNESEAKFRAQIQEECRFGVCIVDPPERHRDLRSRMKRSKKRNVSNQGVYESTPTQVESLIKPTYKMYIGGPEHYLSTFENALKDPERLLYLGRSDDLVDIREVSIDPIKRVDEPATVDCVVPEAGDDPELLPVEPDYLGYRNVPKPARVETVSVTGGDVDHYYETPDGERFVYVL